MVQRALKYFRTLVKMTMPTTAVETENDLIRFNYIIIVSIEQNTTTVAYCFFFFVRVHFNSENVIGSDLPTRA